MDWYDFYDFWHISGTFVPNRSVNFIFIFYANYTLWGIKNVAPNFCQ